MEMVNLRPNRQEHFDNRPRNSLPKMVAARADMNRSIASDNRDFSATFGQRRHVLASKISKPRVHDDDIIKPSQDGGMSISFIPRTSSRDDRDLNQLGKGKEKRKSGIEYLGAGLERGVERPEVPESDRKGRTQRRKGIRSGSKNAFRGL